MIRWLFVLAFSFFVIVTVGFYIHQLPVMLLSLKVQIGMSEDILIQRLGQPRDAFSEGQPREDDPFYGRIGIRPASNKALAYFYRHYLVVVYIDRQGKVFDIDLRNEDDWGHQIPYQISITRCRIWTGIWLSLGVFVIGTYLLQRSYKRRAQTLGVR